MPSLMVEIVTYRIWKYCLWNFTYWRTRLFLQYYHSLYNTQAKEQDECTQQAQLDDLTLSLCPVCFTSSVFLTLNCYFKQTPHSSCSQLFILPILSIQKPGLISKRHDLGWGLFFYFIFFFTFWANFSNFSLQLWGAETQTNRECNAIFLRWLSFFIIKEIPILWDLQ